MLALIGLALVTRKTGDFSFIRYSTKRPRANSVLRRKIQVVYSNNLGTTETSKHSKKCQRGTLIPVYFTIDSCHHYRIKFLIKSRLIWRLRVLFMNFILIKSQLWGLYEVKMRIKIWEKSPPPVKLKLISCIKIGASILYLNGYKMIVLMLLLKVSTHGLTNKPDKTLIIKRRYVI